MTTTLANKLPRAETVATGTAGMKYGLAAGRTLMRTCAVAETRVQFRSELFSVFRIIKDMKKNLLLTYDYHRVMT